MSINRAGASRRATVRQRASARVPGLDYSFWRQTEDCLILDARDQKPKQLAVIVRHAQGSVVRRSPSERLSSEVAALAK